MSDSPLKSKDSDLPSPPYYLRKLQRREEYWRRQLDGIHLIESCLEMGRDVPLDYEFGSWTGGDWQIGLARLPDRLITELDDTVAPVMRSLRRHPEAHANLRRCATDMLRWIASARELCSCNRPQMVRSAEHHPSRLILLDALGTAGSVLWKLLVVFEEIREAAKTSA